ncbi:MAG: sugar phosphate nucleotidyltransferase [Bacteroidota bacterium]
MKVLIPVAGIGSRLRPHTHTQPKALVPVAGKPIIAHIVDRLIENGISEFVFVVGYLGDKIETYITSQYPHIQAHFVVQEPREGSGHAILRAASHIENEQEVLIVLGDTIASLDWKALIESKETILGVKKVDTPSLFGVAETDSQGIIKKLVEKPKIPKSNLALVGIYKIINPQLLLTSIQYLIDNNIRTQNEYHLTDALMRMVEEGEKMVLIQVDNWYDCGRKETLLAANAILLQHYDYHKPTSHRFPNTIIIPPVSIGADCQIESSILGPNVAIGERAIIKNSIVNNTIIGSFSELQNVVLQSSIIGNDSTLQGAFQSLNIGDSAEINLGK